MKNSRVSYLRDALHRRKLWPFGERKHRRSLDNMDERQYDSGYDNERYKRDMIRLEAARKAKAAKWGDTIHSGDIEAFL